MPTLFRIVSLCPLWLLHGLGAAMGWLVFWASPTYRRRFLENAALAGYAFAQVRAAVAHAGRMAAESPRLWWGALPARLKGLIDRTFLPGFAFRYEKGQTWPDQLLKGRTATLLLTLDTPPWYFRLFQGAPAVRQLDTATLAFCGFKPVRHHLFGPVIKAEQPQRQRWLERAGALGAKAA